MNTDAVGQKSAECETLESAQKQPKCRCKKIRFYVLLAIIVGIVAAGAAYWSLFIRVYRLEVCQSVMKTIQANEELRDALGQPIDVVYKPSREIIPNARIEESEIDVIWTIEGPKGRAKAHALSKLRQGKWETIVMEVVLPNGPKVLLTEAGEENAPPPFTGGAAAEPKKPEPTGPAPEINLSLPPDEGPEK